MCNFNNLDEQEKQQYHEKLLECANNFGGKNFFLQLLEELRAGSREPLISKAMNFRMELGKITWNKVIFNDKILLLQKIATSSDKNLLPSKDDRNYKKILNMVKTLSPIEFNVTPKSRDDGEGFSFKAIDIVSSDETRLNPIFEAIFLCPVNRVKQILNYEAKV